MNEVKHYFRVQQVEMSDNSQLFELVTPEGERVASSTDEASLENLKWDLNEALSEAAERDSDIVVNV